MTNRVLLILACASTALAPSLAARAQSTDRAAAQPAASWSSPSLRSETVVGAKRRGHDQHRVARQRQVGHRRQEARREGHRRRVRDARLGDRQQLRDRSAGRLDRHRYRRPHAGRYGDARDARADARPQDQGGRDPADPPALRERQRCISGPWRRDLGTRASRPQHARDDRHQRPERHLPGPSGRAVRRVPSDERARRVPEQARLHAGEAAGGLQLPAADTAVPGRPRRRPGRGRHAGAGRSPPDGHERQRWLLLPRQAPACHQLHAIRGGVQHLLAARRFVPQSGGIHPGRALGRVEERADPARHPWPHRKGRGRGARRRAACRRPGATDPRPDAAPDRTWPGRTTGGRTGVHAAQSARGLGELRAGREPRPTGLQRHDGLVRRRRVRHQSAVRERGSGAYRATDGRRRRGAEGRRRRQRSRAGSPTGAGPSS